MNVFAIQMLPGILQMLLRQFVNVIQIISAKTENVTEIVEHILKETKIERLMESVNV